jgi:hypothetical protein
VVVSAVIFVQLHQTWMTVLFSSASSLTGQELFWTEKEETFS